MVWEGEFARLHSLARVNRFMTDALEARGVEVQRVEPGAEAEPGAEVWVRHTWPMSPVPPREGRWVIVQPWEYGGLPRGWYETFRFVADEVWVPSSFNRDRYLEAGIPAERVRVVPNGVGGVVLTEPSAFPLRTRKSFRFLFVGGTLPRKGIDLLLDAYRRAFRASDDVCLVVKEFGGESFYRGQTAASVIRELQRTPGAPEIEYLTEDLSDAALRDLYHACHCLVHPYRGEGFGMPIAEAMACGLPVVVPDQGGAADFAREGTAVLVPSRRVAVPPALARDLDTGGRPWWIEVDVRALAERMREVARSPESFANVARAGRELVRTHFSWEAAAERAAEGIGVLAERPGMPLRADAGMQYRSRMEAGVEAWERKQLPEALRLFVQARGVESTEDVLFNTALVLLARGEQAAAARVLAELASRLRQQTDEDARALLVDVEAALAGTAASPVRLAPPAGEVVRIRWEAPIFNPSGYASESRSFLSGFVGDSSVDLHLVPHEPTSRNEGLMAEDLHRQLLRWAEPRHDRPHVDFQHGPGSSFSTPAAPLSVCRTMFETDRIPVGWAEACNEFTEVWVPSEFNRQSFARSGVLPEKIRVVPGAIDAAAYDPARYRGTRLAGTRRFAFLSVFDFTPRKGWDVLLRAFCEEFAPDEDVSLVVKVVNLFGQEDPEQRVRSLLAESGIADPPHLMLVNRQCSEDDLKRMYAGADAFVLPSRGEGWGRPYMEAMAFEKPVIGTRWSANLEFMNDRNSFLVEVDGLEPCDRRWAMPLYAGHQWAAPSEASLRQQMRRVFEDREEAARRAGAARADVERHFDVPVVGRRIREEFARLLESG